MKPKLNKWNFTPRMMLHDIQALKNRSRIIERLKYSLPGIALFALMILICWPQAQKWISTQQPTLAKSATVPLRNNTATNPEYRGTDDKNQPYTITADYGTEISTEEIDLTNPKMVMTLKSGDYLTLKASSGKLNKMTNNMHLIGKVTLTHSHGYILETPELIVIKVLPMVPLTFLEMVPQVLSMRKDFV